MAYEAFLKISGVMGQGRNGEIPLEAVNWGAARQGGASAGAGAATGRAVLSDLVVVKLLDKSSPSLFEACASGKHFPSASLTLIASTEPFQMAFLKLEGLVIDSVNVSGNVHGDAFPTEQVSLSFSKIEFSFEKAT